MTLDKDDLLNSIMSSLDRINNIKSGDLPNIDLYMDQVTTFMQSKLKSAARNPEEDKILTKTMINNYAKNGLIPPPDKKKYTPEHIMILTLLFYYKSFLSMSDIDMLLSPVIKAHYRNADSDVQFGEVFHEIFATLTDARGVLDKSVDEALEMAKKSFAGSDRLTDEDRDNIQLLIFASILGQDIFAKLMIMQRLIDSMPKDGSDNKDTK